MRIPIAAAAALLPLAAVAQRGADAEPPWRASALALVPKGFVAGQAYRSDATTGLLAVYPEGADDPATPGSVFAPRQMLMVRLEGSGAEARAVAAELRPRDAVTRGNRDTTMTDPDGLEAEFQERHDKLAAARGKLPEGAEPCDLGAWSADKDPNGLNVRAAPSATARVLGRLPPPYKFKARNGSENTPDGGWLTEFRIVGFKAGWFLIEGATPPGRRYEDDKVYPRSAPKPYAGRGWVAANKVGGSFANGGTRMGGLFQAPHVDARWTPVANPQGGAITADGGPQRILACSGTWGLVESFGVRGWWRALCSNQVTNCS